MTSAYFAPLVTLPAIIAHGGQYRTRWGEIVTVGVVSSRHDFSCEGHYSSGQPERWHKSGRLYATTESSNDIVGACHDE